MLFLHRRDALFTSFYIKIASFHVLKYQASPAHKEKTIQLAKITSILPLNSFFVQIGDLDTQKNKSKRLFSNMLLKYYISVS